MASWQSPGLGPARPLTVTLAPRAQLGTRPGLAGRREPGPGLGREGLEAAEWAMDSRLAGQLLTWETCPTSPGGQGLNTLPRAPTAPPTATGGLPGTTALRARLGWVSVPFSVWGQHSLPGARESLCPWGRPWLGASLPTLAVCPPATAASWTSFSGSAMAPPSQAPPAAGAGAPCLCSYRCPFFMAGDWGQAGTACVHCHAIHTPASVSFLSSILTQWWRMAQ